MSRKVVPFKMPMAGSPRREGAQHDFAPPPDEPSPAASQAANAREFADASEPERWVRDRQGDFAATVVGAPMPDAAGWSVTFDLAAERNFAQVVALSFALPPVLGWFWAANALERYRRLFA